jgi:hypothetical protein
MLTSTRDTTTPRFPRLTPTISLPERNRFERAPAPVSAFLIAQLTPVLSKEPGEVDEGAEGTNNLKDTAIVPYKIHIRGLDSFNPDDVKAYVAQHFSAGQFERIEWVDDSSANLLFRSESVTTEALVALSALAIVDPSSLPPLEALPAKQYAAKPDSVLQVRFAVEGDKKAAGAAQQSRFYLMHPEYDPEERRRRTDYGRTRYRDRDDGYRGNRRGGRDGRRRDRREDDAGGGGLTFDASLYDDDSSALAQRSSHRRDQPRRQSTSSDSVHSDRYRPNSSQNREKELFPGRLNASTHRDRARSASPARDRDGDAHMGEDDNARAAAAMRNREKGRSIKERLIKETASRENTPRELFPEKSHGSKELFPSKVSSGLGSKAQMDQVDDTTILASGMCRLLL